MTNEEIARAYWDQAAEILREAENLYHRSVWNLVIRRSQEVVELALKGALRWVGIEVPRAHEVGVWLKEHRRRFPADFQQEIDRLASISRRLRREREVSFYGDEEIGAPPQALYTEADAREALQDAAWIMKQVRRLMG